MADSPFPFVSKDKVPGDSGAPQQLFGGNSGGVDYSKMLFLVVDSLQEMRSALNMTLSSFGANKVEFASRVSDALGKIQRVEYDVIISDYDLGHGFDGINLLDEIKQRNLVKQSCVFFVVTAERRAQKVISAVELAPDDYLLKPFTGETLRMRLDRALKKKLAFRVVDEAILNHEYLRAISLCNDRIAARDEYAVDFMRLKGRLSLMTGDFVSAKDTYSKILAAKPIAWAKMGLAKTMHHMKEFDNAIMLFEDVLRENGRVMEAYDWLAKTHSAKKEYDQAQEVLASAVKLSPSIVHRQKSLGQVAHRNGELDVAEEAYRNTIQLAKYSFWRDAGDYANLSKVQLDKGDIKGAASTVSEVRKEFKQDDKVDMLANVMESMVCQKSGDTDRAKALLEEAEKQRVVLGDTVPNHFAIEFAQACYQIGDEAKATQVVRDVLKNNHDNTEVLNQVDMMFTTLGQESLGQELITSTNDDIVQVNNKAVRMAQSGDLEGSLELFIRGVNDMPSNIQVTLNAVNALLAYVNTRGWHETYLQLARRYLDKVRTMDPTNGRYQKLNEVYKATIRKYGVSQ